MWAGVRAVRICMDKLIPSVLLLQCLKEDEFNTRRFFPSPTGGIVVSHGQRNDFQELFIRVILRYTGNFKTLGKQACEASE